MDASEYELEFDPSAFYQFMLKSEMFRQSLAKSEKVRILRQQSRLTPNLEIESQIGTECVEVVIENA